MKEWPLTLNLEGVFGMTEGSWNTTYIKGWLPELMKKMGNVVIFAYFPSDSDDVKFIDIFREEPLKSLKNKLPGLCSFLRETYLEWYDKVCVPNDAIAMRYLFSELNSNNTSLQKTSFQQPNGWTQILTHEDVPLYRYMCTEACFIEYITPVVIDFGCNSSEGIKPKKTIGAFITGQFKPRDISKSDNERISDVVCDVLKSRLGEYPDGDFDLRVAKEHSESKIEPTIDDLRNFMKCVVNITNKCEDLFAQRESAFTAKLQNSLGKMLWVKSSVEEITGSDVNKVQQRLEMLNQYLVSSVRHLIKDEVGAFTRICIIKNCKKINEYDMTKNGTLKGKLDGIWIDRPDSKNYSLWKPSIDLACSKWQDILNGVWASTGITVLVKGPDDFCYNDEAYLEYLDNLLPGIRDYSISNRVNSSSFAIFVFATKDRKNYPIAFLVEDNTPERVCDKHIVRDVLAEGIAQKYLVQWNEIFSDYQRILIETSASYIEHEIGQVQHGLQSITKATEHHLSRAKSKLFFLTGLTIDNDYVHARIMEALKQVNYLAHEELISKNKELINELVGTQIAIKDYANDLFGLNSLLELLSQHQFSSLLNVTAKKEYFLPFGDCLYGLRDIYKRDYTGKGQEMRMPSLSKLKEQPEYKQKLYTDEKLFRIISNNLIRNAVKYSWPGSLIDVDCKYDTDKSCHVFEVISYGQRITAIEDRQIFELKMRGSNAKGSQGMGIGLFLVKHLVEHILHGKMNYKRTEVSEACVPMFQYLDEAKMNALSLKHMEKNPSKTINYFQAYRKSVREGWYDKIVAGTMKYINKHGNSRLIIITDTMISTRIGMPTDEYRFTIEFH